MVKDKQQSNKVFWIGACLLIFFVWLNYGLLGPDISEKHEQSFAEIMMRGVDYSEKLDVEEIDLFANVYREKLGLYVVKNNWQKTYSFSNSEAKAKAFIYVDDKDVPRILHVVKNDLMVEEYQLKGQRYETLLNGPAGIWNKGKGLIKSLTYKNNLLRGKAKIFIGEDEYISSEYEDNEIANGGFIDINDDGLMLGFKNYKNKQLNGLSFLYDEEGFLTQITNYKNGKKDGVQVHFYKDKVISKEYMLDGMVQKFVSFDELGRIRNEVNYSHKGYFLGEQKEYLNGALVEQTCYSEPNKKHGAFHDNGFIKYYWHGENLGPDDMGKDRYQKKYQIAKDQRECPYKENPNFKKINQDFLMAISPYDKDWRKSAK